MSQYDDKTPGYNVNADPEKGTFRPEDVSEISAEPAEVLVTGNGLYARTQWIVARFGVEARGIERVPEDERTDTNTYQIGTMWLAANMVVSAFAIGALAYPVFYLGFVDALLAILFFNILGVLPVCFMSTFGPEFGLRQMVLSRFFFGWHGVKVIAFLNCLACIGWSAVNTIVGAQLFVAVNSDMPSWSGILIIGLATFLITCFGYKVIHAYEKYSWIPCFIIFLIALGEFARSGEFYNIPMGVGVSEAGAILSFGASVFAYATGWTSYAADYTVYQPKGTSKTNVFLWTFAGLIFPLLFTEMLGLAIATAMANNQVYYDAYTETGIGGLLSSVLLPSLGKFGSFCVVILALSIIANNCPNIYSISLSLQVLASWTARVPRFLWTLFGTLIYVAIAIPGYSHFESVLENFMLIIAYWLAIYEGVALPEHFIFRRGYSAYNPQDYQDRTRLPPGLAAMAACLFGVAGAVLGMAQVWFVGPIGRLCGAEYGGDVGFELAFAFTASTYCGFRALEMRIYGR